ncbi:MAG: endonuclease/exonuclease/phosphatase family protein [Planctomycetes bacterium]|nr:endonuclease/exonuclease/phosphatase family protein [Planctomycetota bacterium]
MAWLHGFAGATIPAWLLLAALGCLRRESSSRPEARPPPRPRIVAEASVQGDEFPAAKAQPLRIATYNINWANLRLEEVVELIRRADADVVCLQETNAQSAHVSFCAWRNAA